MSMSKPSKQLQMETSAASLLAFPNDVIIEILRWLPVKTLLRFRSVCKSWISLISSQEFIKPHHENSKADSNFAHRKIILNCGFDLNQCSFRSLLDEPKIDDFDSDFAIPFSVSVKFVLCSCYGLCLVETIDYLILWNPTMRTWKKLPPFDVEILPCGSIAYGFGFDKSIDDFKVVGFSKSDTVTTVKIYSLKSDKWRRIKNFDGRWVIVDPEWFVNGKLHGLATSNLELKSGRKSGWGSEWDIFTIDFETEEYGILDVPNYVKNCFDAHFVSSEGRLYVFCNHITRADLWIMGDHTWTKAVTIPYNDHLLRHNYQGHQVKRRFICLHNHEL